MAGSTNGYFVESEEGEEVTFADDLASLATKGIPTSFDEVDHRLIAVPVNRDHFIQRNKYLSKLAHAGVWKREAFG